MSKLHLTFYISTGAKNALYTLRINRLVGTHEYPIAIDDYVKTLGKNLDECVEKAREHVESVRERFDGKNAEVYFDPNPDQEIFDRRGKLSVKETQWILKIEEGVFPFGKHQGTKIEDAPDGYILFFADKLGNEKKAVMGALASACLGVALDRGLIAKREAKREEIRQEQAKSEWIGEVGERREFEGQVYQVFYNKDYDFYITKIKVGEDIITYIGKKIAEKDEAIKIKATIKRHDLYKEIKTTVVNRPKIM